MLSDRSAESQRQKPMQVENADLEIWEHHIEANIESDNRIPDTEREALIVARRGQGLFKQRVMEIESRCRITGVTNPIHLQASHCKPWRDSDNEERLNGENGLLLTPTIDHLFDRGFIGFENGGDLYVAVTDKDWFSFHASKTNLEEVNFWRPSPDATFKALQPGELLLFKLHAPENFIAGGGFFALPVNLVWDTFG